MIEEFANTEQWIKCKEECSKNEFTNAGCFTMPTHLYVVNPRSKSTTRRAEIVAEEPQTSRFGSGTHERYVGNDTTIIVPKIKLEDKINRTACLQSVALSDYSDYYKNKQKLKESIKGIKERIGKITGKKAVSPTSSGSRVIYSDDSLSSANNIV